MMSLPEKKCFAKIITHLGVCLKNSTDRWAIIRVVLKTFYYLGLVNVC